MADVTRPVSLSQQIRLVAGLRWRILRNSLRKKNNVLDLVGMAFVSFFGLVLILGGCLGFYLAGYSLVSGAKLQWLAAPLWGIFIFWQVFPIFAAGFGSHFEFRTLLRFPFSGAAFYLIGLAYGLADFPALASVCWLLAMTAGAGMAIPSVLPAMLAIVLLFVLLNVTIERLIGSWLERLLARRRSREIFFGLFILSMFSLQFISPLQRYLSNGHPALLNYLKYLAPFPPSLSARAVAGAIHHNFTEIVVGLSGLVIFLAVFSGLLWQRYAAQYRGEELSEGISLGRARPAAAAHSHELDTNRYVRPETARNWRDFFGLLSPAVGAMVRKEYSYLVRNGYAFLLLVLPPAQILLFSAQFAGRRPLFGGKGVNTDFFFPGMMAYTILILMGPAYNAFSHESRGMQTYFMAPLKFQDIFVGKNLITVAMVSFEVLVCGGVLAWRIGLPSAPVLVSTILALIFTVTGQLPIANWSSLSFPRKLEFGSMRNQRNSGVSVWLMFGAQIVMAGISSIVLWTGRWTHSPWLAAEAFALLAAAAFGGYFASLQPLAELAEKKKEILIEALCR